MRREEEDMDVEKVATQDKSEEDVILPGFRFHPTDEELVGFYLQRKVEKKPLRMEIIKQIDIYKYDPWDLSSKFGIHLSSNCSLMISLPWNPSYG